MPVFFHKFLPFTDKPPLETIKLEPERDEVFVGENLSCSAQANPAPYVELKFFNKTSERNFKRTWLKIQSITEGNYAVECLAWNDHGNNTRKALKSIRSEYYQGADFSTFCVNVCIKEKQRAYRSMHSMIGYGQCIWKVGQEDLFVMLRKDLRRHSNCGIIVEEQNIYTYKVLYKKTTDCI